MLEKVIKTSNVKILSDYYHTNLRERTREKNVKKMQETFSLLDFKTLATS